MRGMISSLESNTTYDTSESKPLLDAFEAMLASNGDAAASDSGDSDIAKAEDAVAQTFFGAGDGGNGEDSGSKKWKISFKPEPQILLTGNEPLRIFRELEGLGEIDVTAKTDGVPEFQQLTLDECFISWEILLTTESDKEEIESAFDWVLDECELTIEDVSGDASTSASGDSVASQAAAGSEKSEVSKSNNQKSEEKEAEPTPASKAPASKKPAAKSGGESSQAGATSIRVGIDKVDNLINLVGELVITQSMLSELGNNFDIEKLERLSHGLEQLKQNTRELQENVMRIRMLPISFAFNRFPRMIRDLSNKTGKKVDLVLLGEQTELDKTVMEQIGDPLVHLVRNAVDHGLEMPEDRVASGKEETGKIILGAEHKGGNIVIEISDDGRGMDPEKILAKAREKGVVSEDQELTNQEIYELIFEPGFSTAAEVSDLSGRGVGMDVVRRNIKSLGGRIEIESELGKGSCIRVHLPLTLAILDGQLVRVGEEVFIIPLVAIVESLQIKPELVNRVSGNMELYRLREDNVPIIPVYREFNINADKTDLENALLVVVEGDGCKIGLLVDDLLAQQQVVIKSLESNYRSVNGVSGATILGDGSVALILDIPGLITSASQNRRKPQGVKAA
jgi:two-component system chemotaxis sensor kinase CheA